MNGTGTVAAAHPSDGELAGAAGFKRSDVVRLVTQCLQGLGYHSAASKLEQDSGILLLAEPVQRFRQGILEGHRRSPTASHSHSPGPTRYLTFKDPELASQAARLASTQAKDALAVALARAHPRSNATATALFADKARWREAPVFDTLWSV